MTRRIAVTLTLALRSRFDVVQAIGASNRYTLRATLKEPFAPFL